jgi:hypothetical protein
MRTTLLTFASAPLRERQARCLGTGLKLGGFDRVVGRSPGSLDPAFREQHRSILDEERGAGLWLWKPVIISEELGRMQPGDWLFYADADAEFIAPIAHLVTFAEREQRDVVVFDLNHAERSWTKRDAFVLLDADVPELTDTLQRLGGFSLWRSTDASRNLAAEWLDLARDRRILSDDANVMGLENYPEFQAHRHDQSILSILSKRRGIPAARDPSQYGADAGSRRRHPGCDYPQLVRLPEGGLRWRLRSRRSARRALAGDGRPSERDSGDGGICRMWTSPRLSPRRCSHLPSRLAVAPRLQPRKVAEAPE